MKKALINLPVLTAAAFSIAATAVLVVMAFDEGPTLLLEEPWAAPDFEVTGYDGEVITKQSMLGEVWVCDFFLTRCGLVCPMLARTMAGVLNETMDEAGLSEVRFVSFSVDPEHDTLKTLNTYREQYYDIWSGGDDALREQIKSRWTHARAEDKLAFWQLVRDGFKLSVGPSVNDESTPIAHSSRLVLIDKRGRIRGYYEGMNETEVPALIADIRRLVNEPD